MTTYKHISFDLWNTLITGNPQYAVTRLELIVKYWKVSAQEAQFCFKQARSVLECLAEQEGLGIGPLVATKVINSLMPHKLAPDVLMEFHKEQKQNFYDNLPFLDPRIIELIAKISTDFNTNLLSNTVFVGGETLRLKVLEDLLPYFSFTLFSDEQGYSKPHPEFFRKMIAQAKRLQPNLKREEILHVGDNLIADGAALEHGIAFLHVLNPEDLLTKLPSLVYKDVV